MTAVWRALAAPIALSAASCVGRWALFDPEEPGEDPEELEDRHNHAEALCRRCPVLEACQTWVNGLPKSKRPTGVVAGHKPQRRR